MSPRKSKLVRTGKRAIAHVSHNDVTRQIEVSGRPLWALCELIAAGPAGCSTMDNPAPRWSGYVHELRRLGLDIETVHEPHGGEFPGVHARYVLRSRVSIEQLGGGQE